jgi:L,D-transpeptidase ErfK/SrfK
MVRIDKARMVAAVCVCLFSQAAGADTFVLPPDDVDLVGAVSTIRSRYEDTLVQIARDNDLGYEEIIRANPGVDPWLPGEGTEILLPKRFILPPVARQGIIINLPEMRIYYYPKPLAGETPMVITHPISIGRMDWTTPLGKSRVISKIKDPRWYPPESVRAEHAADGDPLPKIVPAGPDNPLGAFAMRLSIPGYLIHGTNRPSGVGMRVTHGCIRLLPEDIETLFARVPVNTPVRIINMPSKVGWSMDTLYLEVHPVLDDDTENLEKNMTTVTEMLVAATREKQITVDWAAARDIYEQAVGVPLQMSVSGKNTLPGFDPGAF